MGNRLPIERPSFPWVPVATVVGGVIIGLLVLRVLLGMLLGFAKLAIIVLIAAAIGAALLRSKAKR